MIFSEYCLVPQKRLILSRSQVPLSVQPTEGNWKQRLQLVRQLNLCFVSFTYPLSHLLITILSSSISHSPFTCSFMFLSLLAWSSVRIHTPVLFSLMCSSLTRERIYNSFSFSAVHLLLIAPPSSFSLPVSLCLFISFIWSLPHHPSILFLSIQRLYINIYTHKASCTEHTFLTYIFTLFSISVIFILVYVLKLVFYEKNKNGCNSELLTF